MSASLSGRAGNIVVIIASRFGLDGPSIESEIFRTRPERPALSPPSLLGTGSLSRGVDHPPHLGRC